MRENVFKKGEECEHLYDSIKSIDLPIPPDVYQRINAMDYSSCGYRFLDKINGLYAYRYFKISNTKTHGFRYVEVARRFEGIKETLINYNCSWCGMAGWYVYYTLHNEWYWVKNFNLWCFENDERTKKIISEDKELKYCAYELQENLDAVEYISYYRKFPKLELLSKLGISNTIRSYRSMKIEKKSFEDIFGFPKMWLEPLKQGYSVNEIKNLHKKKIDPSELYLLKTVAGGFNTDLFRKISKYIRGSNLLKLHNFLKTVDRTLYADYLKDCLRKGIDLYDDYWFLNKNYKEKHEEWIQEEATVRRIKKELELKTQIEKYKKQNKTLLKVIKKYMNLNVSNGRIDIKLPTKVEEIIINGDALSICVGLQDYGYIGSMLSNKNLILFAYIGSEPIECIEYDWKNNKIIQCRGHNNRDSLFHDEIVNLVETEIISKNNCVEAKELAIA